MKIHDYREMMRHLVRAPDKLSKEEKKEVVKDFHKESEKAFAKKEKNYDESVASDAELYNKLADKDPVRYTSIMSGRYDGNPMPKDYPRKEFAYVDRFGNRESATDRIQEQDKKKKVAKKPRPKPTYLNGNVIDITPMINDAWWLRNEIDPPEEESRLLLVPKSKAEGIETILNFHRRQT